jgi:hypothetical protein
MNMPFTVEQFFDVFQIYNTAIWPAQIVAYVLGIVALGMALRPSSVSSRIVSTILAAFWIWMGVFYHLIYYSHINSAAWIFGILSVLQGVLFLAVGTFRGQLSFGFRFKPLPMIGACFMLYAMVIYPLLGISLGHAYPRAPMFGVAPCPTTIFTFGLLLWVGRRGACLPAHHSFALVVSGYERSPQLTSPSRLWTRGCRSSGNSPDSGAESSQSQEAVTPIQ